MDSTSEGEGNTATQELVGEEIMDTGESSTFLATDIRVIPAPPLELRSKDGTVEKTKKLELKMEEKILNRYLTLYKSSISSANNVYQVEIKAGTGMDRLIITGPSSLAVHYYSHATNALPSIKKNLALLERVKIPKQANPKAASGGHNNPGSKAKVAKGLVFGIQEEETKKIAVSEEDSKAYYGRKGRRQKRNEKEWNISIKYSNGEMLLTGRPKAVKEAVPKFMASLAEAKVESAKWFEEKKTSKSVNYPNYRVLELVMEKLALIGKTQDETIRAYNHLISKHLVHSEGSEARTIGSALNKLLAEYPAVLENDVREITRDGVKDDKLELLFVKRLVLELHKFSKCTKNEKDLLVSEISEDSQLILSYLTNNVDIKELLLPFSGWMEISSPNNPAKATKRSRDGSPANPEPKSKVERGRPTKAATGSKSNKTDKKGKPTQRTKRPEGPLLRVFLTQTEQIPLPFDKWQLFRMKFRSSLAELYRTGKAKVEDLEFIDYDMKRGCGLILFNDKAHAEEAQKAVLDLKPGDFLCRAWLPSECNWKIRRVDLFHWIEAKGDRTQSIIQWFRDYFSVVPWLTDDMWEVKETFECVRGYIAHLSISPEAWAKFKATFKKEEETIWGMDGPLSLALPSSTKGFLDKMQKMCEDKEAPEAWIRDAAARPKLDPPPTDEALIETEDEEMTEEDRQRAIQDLAV